MQTGAGLQQGSDGVSSIKLLIFKNLIKIPCFSDYYGYLPAMVMPSMRSVGAFVE